MIALNGESKVCTKCQEVKAIEHFYINKDPRQRLGFRTASRCKACTNKDRREWRTNNIEKSLEQRRRSYHRTKDDPDNKARAAAYRVKYRDRLRDKKRAYYQEKKGTVKDRRFKKKYGISLGDFHSRIEFQNGKCPICTRGFDLSSRLNTRYPVVHHCHKTNATIAIICNQCNMIEGLLRNAFVADRMAKFMHSSELFETLVSGGGAKVETMIIEGSSPS